MPPPEAIAPDLPEAPEPMAFDFDGPAGDMEDADLLMPPPPPPQGPGQIPPPPRKPDPQKVAELKERILQYKYDRMKQAVGMDDDTWQKFFKIYKPAETDMEAVVKQRNEEMKKLGQMMKGAKTDADVDAEMEKIRDLNHKLEDRVMKLNDDLKPVLTARQRARYLIFERQFNTRVHEQVIKQREKMKNMTPEQRRERRQQVRKWWLDHHPAHPGPQDQPAK